MSAIVAAIFLLVLAEVESTTGDSLTCAPSHPLFAFIGLHSDSCAEEQCDCRSKAPLLLSGSHGPAGTDVLVLVERPGEWEERKKDNALADIQELYAWTRDTERTESARIAVVQYDFAEADEVDVVVNWKEPFPSSESLSSVLAADKAERAPLTSQGSMLATLRMLAELSAQWIPHGGAVGRAGLEGSPAHLQLLRERDLHVVILTGLGPEGVCSGACGTDLPQALFQERTMSIIASIVDGFEREWNVTVTVLSSSTQLLPTLGDPTAAVTYADGSHFNKALTLQKLIARGVSNSLQTHLLAKGVSFRVFGPQRVGGRLGPALLGTEPIHSQFPSRCTKDTCAFCSPLHGCVGPGQERTTNIVSVGEAGEERAGKIVLTDFICSHGDKMAAESPQFAMVGSHKLSIEQPPCCYWKPLNSIAMETVPVWQWTPTKPFLGELIKNGHPVVLQNSVVKLWPALSRWSWGYLSSHLGEGGVAAVKCTNSFLTFDPDSRAALKLNLSLPFVKRNMTSEEFVHCVTSPHKCDNGFKGYYYFTGLPPELANDTLPDDLLFYTPRDHTARKQSLWMSSPGMITHGHFDQDHNVFVQLKGRKRFTLWLPWEHESLYMYPRVHPMWHKSRVNFQQPDVERFPLFGKSHANHVTLEPGDILYVPPYTWHYVETLDEPSVSMSTWSHDYELYDHMNAVYRHDHKFDLIQSQEGQMYALRLYLDMMVHELYGFNQTGEVFARLLRLRFEGLEHLFPPHSNDPLLCGRKTGGRIPTAVHVHGFVSLDVGIIGRHFKALKPEVRDILFFDYVEEITAQVVGVEKLLAFFRYCFLGQTYYVTDADSPEHSLWDHKDTDDS